MIIPAVVLVSFLYVAELVNSLCLQHSRGTAKASVNSLA